MCAADFVKVRWNFPSSAGEFANSFLVSNSAQCTCITLHTEAQISRWSKNSEQNNISEWRGTLTFLRYCRRKIVKISSSCYKRSTNIVRKWWIKSVWKLEQYWVYKNFYFSHFYTINQFFIFFSFTQNYSNLIIGYCWRSDYMQCQSNANQSRESTPL